MESREDILRFLRENRDLLRDRFGVTRIGLFGSFSRGDQTEESDIDLILDLEPGAEGIHRQKEALREFVASRFRRPVDLAREKYLRPFAKSVIVAEAIYV